jgi:apolipoprotein N-acyltransferase
MNKKLIYLAAFLTGISQPGYSLGILSFAAYVPLFFAVYEFIEKEKTKFQSFKFGFIFGFFYALFAMFWIGLSNPPGMFGAFLTIGGRFGLMTLLFFLLVKKKKHLFLFIPFLVLQEYTESLTEIDFTWHLAGYGLTDFPILIQIAEIGGVYLVSFWIFLINFYIFKIIQNYNSGRTQKFILSVLAIFLIGLSLNFYLYKTTSRENMKSVRVGVIQPNIDAFLKWSYDYRKLSVKRLFKNSELAIKENANLLIWPETAMPFTLRHTSNYIYLDSLKRFAKNNNVTISMGVPDFGYKNGKKVHYNSVFNFTPDKNYETYKKQKLVPVAEKNILPDFLFFLGDLPGMSGWEKGEEFTVFKTMQNIYKLEFKNDRYIRYPFVSAKDNINYSTVICIESNFPQFISKFRKNGAEFLNIITNDGWFYPHWDFFKEFAKEYNFSPYIPSKGPLQHERIAMLRAVENRMSVVRSANTGISSIIDPFGHRIDHLDQFVEGYIVNEVPILEQKSTFYNSFGNWIVWFSLISIVFFGIKKIGKN